MERAGRGMTRRSTTRWRLASGRDVNSRDSLKRGSDNFARPTSYSSRLVRVLSSTLREELLMD